jgi:TatA/E family protein of Tat protein translocase
MLSIPHLIIIFVVALVVFGPEKLPELARNLGKVMAEFRKATGELRGTFEGHLQDLERETQQRQIGGGAAASTPAMPQPAPGTVTANAPHAAAAAGQAYDDDGNPIHPPDQQNPDTASESKTEKMTDAGSRPA